MSSSRRKWHHLAIIPVIAFLALAAWPVSAEVAAPDRMQPVIYRNVTLIDGTGGPPQRGMAVIVEGDRIKAVQPDASLGRLPEGNAVDATGLFLIPGLIDTHVHFATSPNRRVAEDQMRRYVFSGVTAVRDMAGDARLLNELGRASLVGEIPGPDIIFAAVMAGPSFFKDPRTIRSSRGATPGGVPWMQAIAEDSDLSMAIALARGSGASGIKIYANLPARLIARIVSEAHRQNMPVWAHLGVFPATPGEVVKSGVDVVSHICMLPNELSDPLPQSFTTRGPFDYERLVGEDARLGDIFADMKRRGTILDATLGICAADDLRRPETGPNTAMPKGSVDLSARLLQQARRAGVAISTGTDRHNEPRQPFPFLHDEFELLSAKAGLSPREIVLGATSIAARALGRQREMGTIEPGKLANLVFLSKNPLIDARNLRSVVFTVKRGTVYERRDYRPQL